MDTSPLPKDPFSLKLRECSDHPGTIEARSTIQTQDFYGNAESWIVRTFRVEGSVDVVFIERLGAESSERIVLPPKVCAALAQHRDTNAARARRRSAATAMATKRSKGMTLGNPAALAKAREKRKRGKK